MSNKAPAGFTVAGSLDGTLYEVQVTGDPATPVVGSKRVARLVEQWTGETVMVTPVGPAYDVDPGDPASVLALLAAKTRVRWASDGAPVLVEPLREGHVR